MAHICKRYESAKRELKDLRKRATINKTMEEENKELKKENRRLKAALEELRGQMFSEPDQNGIDLSGLFIPV